MPRFFINEKPNEKVIITGEDAVHIGRSLRMKIGEEIVLCHNGMDFLSKIENITDKEVVCVVSSIMQSQAEPSISVTLYQALPKSDKMEFIVQKAVELGVTKIVPVLTSRCVSRPDAKTFEKKRARLKKISLSAAKQSGRGIIPEISEILSIEKAIDDMVKNDLSLICYEKGGASLNSHDFRALKSVGLFIGSEGGFEQAEVDKCISKGVIPIGLGKRILRCETAPICAISIIMNLSGNM
ncbi:MAG: 16S rRNA (uracil(1498)-N(3))-methyltransferase [Clostridiales bacterium]|nr:16S rRNA (uracil(1498)-N(3))-methyltransferase [Clostridiales bacterium]